MSRPVMGHVIARWCHPLLPHHHFTGVRDRVKWLLRDAAMHALRLKSVITTWQHGNRSKQ